MRKTNCLNWLKLLSKRTSLVLGIWYLALGTWCLADQAVITQIEAKHDRGFDYLDIFSSADTKGKGLLLEDKLVIDFEGAKISAKIKITERRSTRIKNIRAYQYQPGIARVVIDLKKGIDYDLVSVFGRAKTVVEISNRIDEAEKIIAAWEHQNLALAGNPLKTKKLVPTASGSLKGKTIVVDPGHGGKDPGATSITGIEEKVLTLQTAQKLAQELTDLGATVYLTRNDDTTSNLKQIVDFTNQTRPDIFISVHYNYTTNKEVEGTETYYYTNQSRPLALAIHKAMTTELARRDRGLRKVMFYAVHHTQVPAILVEPLYLSSYNDERLAKSADFQEKITKAIAEGVKNYFRTR
ncbi:hypothetical protein COT42_00400 [Candidatus Saganbacteria bacterium CG08_land_8_20_14_0_20_45_16]|uniref:MurNAc-LAA domain-containing protein n=1 Tax=Candidatus Saganbacteria bacterium CG08_land_8_20_14_0_20_45_16 TaxID=2014293 RepID=A0A2H0Y1U0_UNCSA|nr:MAG: hypothetical protein COT42_00400 [Candidatus Saganbacteria bacterium CG08_land_8_20_14_0_20_45_16]